MTFLKVNCDLDFLLCLLGMVVARIEFNYRMDLWYGYRSRVQDEHQPSRGQGWDGFVFNFMWSIPWFGVTCCVCKGFKGPAATLMFLLNESRGEE
mmetsp:Transcript_22320/g.45691  ORF Transcript_22320/g.45691 Transcript_22320/m.45691 type:complete len:95 (+) Transcript_22320:3478-3762(+)